MFSPMTMIAAASMALQSMPLPSDPNWQPIGGDAQGEFSLLPASVQRDGDRVRAQIRLRFAQAAEGGLREGVMQYELNCRANTIRVVRSDTYTDDGFAGTEAPAANILEDVPIRPGTPNSVVRDRLCAS